LIAGIAFLAGPTHVQPCDHADVNRVTTGNTCKCFAARPALDSLGALVFRQFPLPAELDERTSEGRKRAMAVGGAFPDQFAFELSNGSE
jgi:hypothetical protein